MKKLITIILILALALPAVAMAEDQIVGKWSFFWDTRQDNADEIMGTVFINMDLIIFENRLAFLIINQMGYGDKNFSDDPVGKGTWTKIDETTYKLDIGFTNPVHQMELKEDGRLYVELAEGAIYPFSKVPSFSMSAEETP